MEKTDCVYNSLALSLFTSNMSITEFECLESMKLQHFILLMYCFIQSLKFSFTDEVFYLLSSIRVELCLLIFC